MSIYRATVVSTNEATGDIHVRIPSVTGLEATLPISTIARSEGASGWVLPAVGDQIVVAADDVNLNNVFWVQVSPPEPPAEPVVVTNDQRILETQIFG